MQQNYTYLWLLWVAICFFLPKHAMAQTIEGAVLLTAENFEHDGTASWLSPYDFTLPSCFDPAEHHWGRTTQVGGANDQAIRRGTYGPTFWSAWQTNADACGNNSGSNTAIEQLSFPAIQVEQGATLAEVCFDYAAVGMASEDDFIRLTLHYNENILKKDILVGFPRTASPLRTTGWLRHCEVLCLDTDTTTAVDFTLTLSASGRQTWMGIDHVRLYASFETDHGEKSCFGLPPNTTPVANVCSDAPEDFLLFVKPGDDYEEVSWEIRNEAGVRLYYENAVSYTSAGLRKHPIRLRPCENYTFRFWDSKQNGWKNGYWVLVYDENSHARGLFADHHNNNQDEYALAWRDGLSFAESDSFFLSLPCLPDCPVLETIETTNNCLAEGYIPPDIEPTTCPNSCVEPTLVRVYFPSIDTTIHFPTETGVTLPVGTHDVVYEVFYENHQIVRCTSELNVVVEINPTLACNDLVTVSLVDDADQCEVFVLPDMLLEEFIDCSEEYTVVLYDENNEVLSPPDIVGPQHIGQTLTYTVTHMHSDNYCWGNLIVEDKVPPVLTCTDMILACNNPEAFDAPLNQTFSKTYKGDSTELPANIAGGSAANPSVTVLALQPNMNCASRGEWVEEVQLGMRLMHSDVEDLTIRLMAPNGMEVQLLDRPCPNTDEHDLQVTFRDDGNEASCASNANFAISGNIKPAEYNGQAHQGFSKFYDLPVLDLNDTWWLIIYDSDNSTTGNDNEVGQGQLEVADLVIRSHFRDEYDARDCSDFDVVLLDEVLIDTDCNATGGYGGRIERIWEATDEHGNVSTCEQIVQLIAPSFDEIILEDTIMLSCSPMTGTGSLISALPTYDCEEILPEHHIYCDVSFTYEDAIFPYCGNAFELVRTWTLINWCSGVTNIFEQHFLVKDTIAPEITLQLIPIASDSFVCSGAVFVDATFSDDCSEVTQFSASYNIDGGIHNSDGTLVIVDLTQTDTIPNMPIGEIEIEFKAVDECGNIATTTEIVEVSDKIAPIALCYDTMGMNTEIPPIHLSVGSDGTAKLFAEDIDMGSYDNCAVANVEIRRLKGCLDESDWDTEAPFDCCDEADNPIILELRVTDVAGNTDFCQREVYVEDWLAPVASYCPENDTITCENAAIADTFFDGPIFEDNCEVKVDSFTINNVDLQCFSGVLRRTWHASDLSSKSPDTRCTQRIVVLHQSDFRVTFPADTLITSCPDSLHQLGTPLITEDDCELVAISYEDRIFDIVSDACYKIERDWKVVNWCLYNGFPTTGTGSIISLPQPRSFQDENVGLIEYTQTIKVLDDTPPLLYCPNDTIICSTTPDCEGEVLLTVPANDNCSAIGLYAAAKIDLFDDGIFDVAEQSDTITGVFPYGTHTIEWEVSDGCGNVSVCAYRFTLKDCLLPTPVCIDGLSITTQAGNCTPIYTEDLLEYATDNCTSSSFLETFVGIRKEGSTDIPRASILLCCEDLGSTFIEVWVQDEAGNAAYCVSEVQVQNNDGSCEDSTNIATIAGQIVTPNARPIPDVAVQLHGTTNHTQSDHTQSEGYFQFNEMPTHQNYVLHPQKTDGVLDGVTTFDLVRISQHILGIHYLDSPYALIAADANSDGQVTTFDVVQIRQLILYIISDFPNNHAWRLVRADYIFPNPANPWQEAFPEAISFLPLTQNELYANFIGVKIGDVNGDALMNFTEDTQRHSTMRTIWTEDTFFEKNTELHIPFLAKDNENIKGMQFSMQFDPQKIRFKKVQTREIEEGQVFVHHEATVGILHLSWYQNEVEKTIFDQDAVLFDLVFETRQAGKTSAAVKLSDRYLRPELYEQQPFAMQLGFINNDDNTVQADFRLYSNHPNPFTTQTTIAFYIPAPASAALQVFDKQGHLVHEQRAFYQKGYHTVVFSEALLPQSGVYFYRLQTEQYTQTKRMVVVK